MAPGSMVQLMVKSHVACSVAILAGASVNYFLLNPQVTRALAWLTIPATLPIFPLTAYRFTSLTSGFAKGFILSLNVGGLVNLWLAGRVLIAVAASSAGIASYRVPFLHAGIGPMRLETALVISTIGATILNGKRFVPRFGLQNTRFGKLWMWFSNHPPISMGMMEVIGALLLLWERHRIVHGTVVLSTS